MERDADGNYTGRVEGTVVQGPEKVAAVTRWADAHIGKGAWTLAYAYGDHHTDAALLSAATKGYAVCPGETLRKLAAWLADSRLGRLARKDEPEEGLARRVARR